MDAAKQREIASKGGQSVPPEKRSFSQNPQLAAAAGRKGGLSVSNADRSFSRNRRLAAEAGRKGGSQSSAVSQRRPVQISEPSQDGNPREERTPPRPEYGASGERKKEKELAGAWHGGYRYDR